MAITTSQGKNVDFLGLTERIRKNILRALVGNLSGAQWAYKTAYEEDFDGTGTRPPIFQDIQDAQYQNKKQIVGNRFSPGYMVFQDSDNLNLLATDYGIWVKVYPTRGRYLQSSETGTIADDFCVYLTLCYYEPNADGSNVIEPSTKVSLDEEGNPYIDEDAGECDDPNFCRFQLAYHGISRFLKICDSSTPAYGNEGRDVNVVAAVNSALQQEIKFNRSTKPWDREYGYFALYTGPGTAAYPGQIIAWGKLTDPIEVTQADVVPLFEEGKFRLFFPAPNEVETQINAEYNDTEH